MDEPPFPELTQRIHQGTTQLKIRSEDWEEAADVTAFFYAAEGPDSGEMSPLLITSEHAVSGGGYFGFWTPGEDGEYVEVPDPHANWIAHPHPHADITALPLHPVMSDLFDEKWDKNLEIEWFHRDNIPDPDEEPISPIEEVVMLGYPLGITGVENAGPIARQGITATPLTSPWDEKPWTLMDIPAFRGNSGSPIMIYRRGAVREDRTTYTLGERFALVGIHMGPPQTSWPGDKSGPDPTNEEDTEKEELPEHEILDLGVSVDAQLLKYFGQRVDILLENA